MSDSSASTSSRGLLARRRRADYVDALLPAEHRTKPYANHLVFVHEDHPDWPEPCAGSHGLLPITSLTGI